MDVVIPLALLVVGLIIGFFVARFMYLNKGSNKASEAAERNIKEIMAQQAEHHIHQTRHTIEAIESQCQALRQQVEEYDALLSQNTDDATPSVPFYGEQATTYLRNNLTGKEKLKASQSASSQPLDFANTGSGLFVGDSKQSAADKKS